MGTVTGKFTGRCPLHGEQTVNDGYCEDGTPWSMRCEVIVSGRRGFPVFCGEKLISGPSPGTAA